MFRGVARGGKVPEFALPPEWLIVLAARASPTIATPFRNLLILVQPQAL